MSQTILTTQNVLKAVITASTLAKELGDSCPPARAAASLLLMIFQAVESLKTNQIECYRLAQRCLDLLTEIQEQMGMQWKTAPPSLVKNLRKFEVVLSSIHARLIKETQTKWHSRLMRRSDISGDINEFNAELDDAARAFQMLSLLNIHYIIEQPGLSDNTYVLPTSFKPPIQKESTTAEPLPKHPFLSQPEVTNEELNTELLLAKEVEEPPSLIIPAEAYCESPIHSEPLTRPASPDLEEFDLIDEPSPRIFHQSELILKGRSRIRDGWWAGAIEVQLGKNSTVLVKRYSSDGALTSYTRDIEILCTLRHPNVPQLLGFSAPGASTPFIVLKDVNTSTLHAYIKRLLLESDVVFCAQTILRFYQDIVGVAMFVQTQLKLSDAKVQDYVENTEYRVDTSGRIVVGLPSPELDTVISVRQWTLSQSVTNILLLTSAAAPGLFETESDEAVDKMEHVASLVSQWILATTEQSVIFA